MAITVPYSVLALESSLDWVELPLVVTDDSPDQILQLQPFNQGAPIGGIRIVDSAGPIRLPRALLGPFASLIGAKSNDTKAYLCLNADLNNDVQINIVAVDETGGSMPTGEGQARIAGTVQIDGVSVSRDVIVISDNKGNRQVLAEGESAGDGSFDITYTGWSGGVIALAVDFYGSGFQADTALNQGRIIHPTTPNGYVYEVTVAGTTGSEEPTWLTDQSFQSGSVTFNPRPFYRPIASGPIQGELVNLEPLVFQYFQLSLIEAVNSSYFNFVEIELAASAGGTSLIDGSTIATATSNYPGYPIDNAIDGSISTEWLSGGNNDHEKVTLDLGQPRDVAELRLTLVNNSVGPTRAPKKFYVYGSTDGIEWIKLAYFENETGYSQGETRAFPVPEILPADVPEPPAEYSQYRLFITANNGNTYVALTRVELIFDGINYVDSGDSATASSNYSGGSYPASNVLQEGGVYLSGENPLPLDLTIDLGSLTRVNTLAITPEIPSPSRAPRDFELQGSTDGQTWETIKVFSGETSWTGRRVYDLTAP